MKSPFFQILIFILSIYVIGAMIIEFIIPVSSEMSTLLLYIDSIICAFFFFDFIISFYSAENKINFMRTGWIDLIASVPTVGILRVGRFAKIIRIIRVFKAAKSLNEFLGYIFKNKADSLFKSILLSSILLIIPAAITILSLEKDVGEINNANDAVWWTLYTMLGMDYCSPPVTQIGKMIALILAIAGMTILGSFTAYLAEYFFNDKK